MIGLILKDLLYLKRMGKVLAALLIFYAVVMINSKGSLDNSLLSSFIVTLTVILGSNVFGHDEASKWRLYELSLPVGKKQIVLARYLFATGLATVLTLLSFLLKWMIFRSITTENVAVLSVSWGVSLLLCSILFPLFYRYGMQKAQLVFFIFFLLSVLGASMVNIMSIPAPSESSVLLLIRLFPVFAALVFFASYWIFCHFYASKDN